MRDASSGINDRIPFLTALVALSDEFVWVSTKADAIYDAIMAWKGTPAIDRLCRDVLPDVLVREFHGFSRWIKQGQTNLPKLLPLTGLDATGELNILLAGVASTRIAVLKASREEADIPQNTLGPLGAIGGNSYEFDHDHDSTQWRTIARLALPISRDNSEALFNDAIGIAKEIDQEAVDQIEFMSVGAEHANIADPAERRRIGANTYSSGAKCVCPAQ